MVNNSLRIHNAKENNLKNLSLEIPHDQLTVITGLSGSGKSSLAFSTVYAEGQRRYIETFSPYTRQFFDKVKKPDAASIDHVRPAIAIQQRTKITGSRSTVGSLTNINDFLKIIWSNLASPHCPSCSAELVSWNASTLVDFVKDEWGSGEHTVLVCAPISIPKKKPLKEGELDRLRALGFSRIFDTQGSGLLRLDEIANSQIQPGELLVVIDRVKTSKIRSRTLYESLDQAFSLSDGKCVLAHSQESETYEFYRFNSELTCQNERCSGLPLSIPKPMPSLFSFNHPYGACNHCRGFGNVLSVDPHLCIPDQTLSIEEGAVQCWSVRSSAREEYRLFDFCETEKIPLSKPWKNLSQAQKDKIFHHNSREYRGIVPWFERLERKAYKMHVRVFISRYRSAFPCPECRGTRLRPGALAYKINGSTLPEIWELPVSELRNWLESATETFSKHKSLPRQIKDVFSAVQSRVAYLDDLGMPYLSLSRPARTLSGGETQRVNLATALGSELVSTQFVLDEPSVGLHPRDVKRLIDSISNLKDRGNSVLVVEHDLDFLPASENFLELGPLSGASGGEVVYHGEFRNWEGRKRLQDDALPVQCDRAPVSKKGVFLQVRGASARNLKGIDLDIPVKHFTCLTGVSGSGKSTLVNDVIHLAHQEQALGLPRSGNFRSVKGFEHFEQILLVDQSSLAKSPRANIATYSGIWDTIRSLLAETEEARSRALSKSSFSFNVDGGRCPECKGAGSIREDMQFLSDVYIPCDTCLGTRFQPSVLEVTVNGLHVSDLLNLTVDECSKKFHSYAAISRPAEILGQLGLGHLRLGHSLSELSGGEAQRLKLIPFLQKSERGSSLLIFDEPTTGLHVRDVKNLSHLLQSLTKIGHTVLCIEHNPSLILSADWIIDLGPEGGEEGGRLLFQGCLTEFVKAKGSYTATYLRSFLKSVTSKHFGKTQRQRTTNKKRQTNTLRIFGAREHNLKNIDVDVPLGKMVAITGVSGSGKSTIAKDIIYSEGQRRYLDCLSPYARQFIKELKTPDIDRIENIPPTVCVHQHTFQPSRLSTIGTLSESYNYLRLLFSKIAIQYCPKHPKEAISGISAEEIAEAIRLEDVPTVRILAPVIKGKKGNHRAVFERAVQSDISEVRVDGILRKPADFLGDEILARNKTHDIDFVVAKFDPKKVEREMLTDCVEQTLGISGAAIVVLTDEGEKLFSTSRTCRKCGQGFFKPDPEDLSFNSKRGACTKCGGRGKLKDGSICTACHGTRLLPTGRNLRIGGKNIHELCLLTPPELVRFFDVLEIEDSKAAIVRSVLPELTERLETLTSMGLDYLPLDRECAVLSTGELQRLRLAAAMGTPLTGAAYILDEPSAGLHPTDNFKVLARLDHLRERGNSVLVIEHDPDSILACDHILEVGPGGGTLGGEIVFNGSRKEFLDSSTTPTAKHLSTAPMPSQPASRPSEARLRILKGRRNNIESISVSVPLHELVCIVGVSGAGKSSLVHGIIGETLQSDLGASREWILEENHIEADEIIDRVVVVDQKPIGKNARSTPASYLGIWGEIRKIYSETTLAKTLGWGPAFFSYNTGKGRCQECKGLGQMRMEMSFLADARMECTSCRGKRFTEEACSVKFKELSISEVLQLTFEEAKGVFANHRKVNEVIRRTCEVGLGYLSLGQESSTLSGGESQRLKLVAELGLSKRGHSLYILDEPTTGLHKADVLKLMKTLREIVSRGSSMYIIEHDQDVITASDHVIELGPGPGDRGGKIIFQGPPSELVNAETAWGRILAASVSSAPSNEFLHVRSVP